MLRAGKIALVAATAAILAACAASGPVDNTVARNLSWFNYAPGADIKAACRPGTPDRHRFIYNGIYDRQIRTYDLTQGPDGADLVVRARGASGNLARLSEDGPFGPWQLTRDDVRVDTAGVNRLLAAFAQDRAGAPPPAGQRLDSSEFYWLVSACENGEFSLAAFRDAKTPHRDLAFPPLLLALDGTGVPFKAARKIEGQRGGDGEFQLRINQSGDGLVAPLLSF